MIYWLLKVIFKLKLIIIPWINSNLKNKNKVSDEVSSNRSSDNLNNQKDQNMDGLGINFNNKLAVDVALDSEGNFLFRISCFIYWIILIICNFSL